MLKMKMQRPTSPIIRSIAAASGSRTNPMRKVCSPNVNQVKFWMERKPLECSVGTNAKIDIVRAASCPVTEKAAASRRAALPKAKIKSAAKIGAAGINQTLVVIQEFIL